MNERKTLRSKRKTNKANVISLIVDDIHEVSPSAVAHGFVYNGAVVLSASRSARWQRRWLHVTWTIITKMITNTPASTRNEVPGNRVSVTAYILAKTTVPTRLDSVSPLDRRENVRPISPSLTVLLMSDLALDTVIE